MFPPPLPYTVPVGNYYYLACGEDPISPSSLNLNIKSLSSVLTQAYTYTRQENESHGGFENVSGISLFLSLEISFPVHIYWAQIHNVEEGRNVCEEALTGNGRIHVEP